MDEEWVGAIMNEDSTDGDRMDEESSDEEYIPRAFWERDMAEDHVVVRFNGMQLLRPGFGEQYLADLAQLGLPNWAQGGRSAEAAFTELFRIRSTVGHAHDLERGSQPPPPESHLIDYEPLGLTGDVTHTPVGQQRQQHDDHISPRSSHSYNDNAQLLSRQLPPQRSPSFDPQQPHDPAIFRANFANHDSFNRQDIPPTSNNSQHATTAPPHPHYQVQVEEGLIPRRHPRVGNPFNQHRQTYDQHRQRYDNELPDPRSSFRSNRQALHNTSINTNSTARNSAGASLPSDLDGSPPLYQGRGGGQSLANISQFRPLPGQHNPIPNNSTAGSSTISSAHPLTQNHTYGNPQPPPVAQHNPPPLPADRLPMGHITNPTLTYTGAIYGAQTRERPPARVQPPATIAIGIIEMCTFLPNWFQLPRVAMRAVHGGWGALDLAKAQLQPLGQLAKDDLSTARARIGKQLKEGAVVCHNWTGDFKTEVVRATFGATFGTDMTSAT